MIVNGLARIFPVAHLDRADPDSASPAPSSIVTVLPSSAETVVTDWNRLVSSQWRMHYAPDLGYLPR